MGVLIEVLIIDGHILANAGSSPVPPAIQLIKPVASKKIGFHPITFHLSL